VTNEAHRDDGEVEGLMVAGKDWHGAEGDLYQRRLYGGETG